MRLSYQVSNGTFRAVDLSGLTEPVVIGRDRDAARLVIPDPQTSRAHCAIKPEDGALILEDLGSRNGTYVNKQRIERHRLQPKDIITIGGTDLRVSVSGTGSASDPLLGKRLGGFEFVEVLGHGSYGTVYRGVQVALHRNVAVKVLDERHKKDPKRVKDFLNEARRAGRLNHPNVVQVHDVCQEEGELFLVMELMMGGSVADLLRLNGKLDSETCLRMLVDIGHALAYGESQGLVHRDVKPDNVLVTDDGVFKLADLGIAAPINADGVAHQLRAFGSAHYVAPEQALGGAIDARADIYALGASLFHLMTGHTMFQGTSRQIVTQHVKSPVPDLHAEAPDYPKPLRDMVLQMLEKDPEKRFGSGVDVANRANEIIETGGKAATPARRRRPARARRGRGGAGGGRGRSGGAGRGAGSRRRH
ncbi:MAG: protein kinase domain-containing protein [Planctomycetota bacterium]